MENLTIVAAYYNQPGIMREWWRVLKTYAEPERIKLRFCDDHSKKHPLVIPPAIQRRFDVQAFRVLDDIHWNEMGARNLCMEHSHGWVFMTDPDYLLNAENVRRLLTKDCRKKNFYHLQSREVDTGKALGMPENMVVLHTEDFWKVHGYDEGFAGGYGFSDCMFFKALRDGLRARDNFVKDVFMSHYPKKEVPSSFSDCAPILDAASPSIRDTKRNQPIWDGKLAMIRKHGIRAYLSQLKPVKFNWERTV